MSAPDEIVPDGKDWTVVLQEGCAECGFAPDDPAVAAAGTGGWLRTTIPRWEAVLARPSVELRDHAPGLGPAPEPRMLRTWSLA